MGITPYALARAILVDPPRIDAIIKGGRRITTDTAVSLSGFFGTTPGFWMNMQSRYDLETLMEEKRAEFEEISRYRTVSCRSALRSRMRKEGGSAGCLPELVPVFPFYLHRRIQV